MPEWVWNMARGSYWIQASIIPDLGIQTAGSPPVIIGGYKWGLSSFEDDFQGRPRLLQLGDGFWGDFMEALQG